LAEATDAYGPSTYAGSNSWGPGGLQAGHHWWPDPEPWTGLRRGVGRLRPQTPVSAPVPVLVALAGGQEALRSAHHWWPIPGPGAGLRGDVCRLRPQTQQAGRAGAWRPQFRSHVVATA
jgi:hypothetical protein